MTPRATGALGEVRVANSGAATKDSEGISFVPLVFPLLAVF